jgi:hypothetical protein
MMKGGYATEGLLGICNMVQERVLTLNSQFMVSTPQFTEEAQVDFHAAICSMNRALILTKLLDFLVCMVRQLSKKAE